MLTQSIDRNSIALNTFAFYHVWMQRENGLIIWAKMTAAISAFLFICITGSTQEIGPPKDLPWDNFKDLRAFGDMVETKERPWADIEKQKPKVGSQKNKDFIDQLKKLHDSVDKGLNGPAVQSVSKQIKDLDLDVTTKVSLMKLTSMRSLHPYLDKKSQRIALWYVANSVIEKSKQRWAELIARWVGNTMIAGYG